MKRDSHKKMNARAESVARLHARLSRFRASRDAHSPLLIAETAKMMEIDGDGDGDGDDGSKHNTQTANSKERDPTRQRNKRFTIQLSSIPFLVQLPHFTVSQIIPPLPYYIFQVKVYSYTAYS
jgi:hypothetical protein